MRKRMINWNYLTIGLVVSILSIVSFFIHAFLVSYVIDNPDTWFMWATGGFLIVCIISGISSFFIGVDDDESLFKND